uniref:Uncharacterized protein n=1 Tax=Acrobeloides nanus TaxID=290746 RepID=A0A914BX38_9BILA
METSKLLSSPDVIKESKSELKKERSHRFLRPKIGSRRIRNRLVQKYGLCNISLVNVPKQHRKYLRDIFTTVIEAKWRWCLLFFSLSFILSWTLFTSIYYVLVMYHGDMEYKSDSDWVPCIRNANDPLNIFLFAFTTQTTIGYGFRYPTDACPLVIMTMCLQFMIGVMCQTMMAGVIFAKLARPIKRAATLLFSKHAVICMRDGKLCLLFRVGDMRKSSLAEAHVRLQMIKKCVTLEGELLPFHQFDMDVGYDSGLDRVFVIWPITICHAILEGVAESVGSTTQARTSYLPNEILWGQRFEKLVTYQRENGEYRIDFSKFHNVVDVYTPTCSAKELDDLRARGIYDENGYLLSPQLSVTDSFGNDDENKAITKNGLTQVVIQADEDDDDERRVSGIALSEMHQRRRSFLCSPSPDAELRRKQSVQVRRGPDLF